MLLLAQYWADIAFSVKYFAIRSFVVSVGGGDKWRRAST